MNQIYRSRENRIIGGVAGGLAEYFGTDVSLVRILFVLATLFAGGGILAYILAWIIIPEKPVNLWHGTEVVRSDVETGDQEPVIDVSGGEIKAEVHHGGNAAGIILIIIGCILLLHQIAPYHFLRYFWPVVLIAGGIFLFTRNKGGGQ